MSVPDSLVALRLMMLADTPTTDLTGTDIFAAELPKEITKSMPKHVLVIKFSPGVTPPMGWARLAGVNIEFWAYGPDPQGAAALKLVVYEKLKYLSREVFNSTLIHNASPLTGGISLRDENTDWPIEIQPFLVMVGETAVP